MRAVVIAATMFTATVAWADQAEDIALKAGACWAIPGALETPPSADFDVVLDESGYVKDITVLTYKPKGDQGKEVVLTASRAILTCAPYKGGSGTIRVLMNATTAFGDQKPIDPFKN